MFQSLFYTFLVLFYAFSTRFATFHTIWAHLIWYCAVFPQDLNFAKIWTNIIKSWSILNSDLLKLFLIWRNYWYRYQNCQGNYQKIVTIRRKNNRRHLFSSGGRRPPYQTLPTHQTTGNASRLDDGADHNRQITNSFTIDPIPGGGGSHPIQKVFFRFFGIICQKMGILYKNW